MYQGQLVFTQLMDHLPRHAFRRLVQRYGGNRRVRSFTCWHQFASMAFAQLTFRESLRDIEACLGAVPEKLYHLGLPGGVARNTLAVANEKRDWRIYAEFAQKVIAQGRQLYTDDALGVDLDQTVYALDSTTIDLCLSLFPWARIGRERSSIKVHTLLDLQGNIPANLWITTASFGDNQLLDVLVPEPGSIYIMDRGYLDFARLAYLNRCRAVFVVRARSNLKFRRLYSHAVERSTGLICDQTIVLTGQGSAADYPDKLRRVRFRDAEKDEAWTYLTNDFELPALTVAELYRSRWQVELFFRWIKQHLRIKAFYGTSPNAVRIQIWIAVTVYVLVAIVRRRLEIDRELYTLLQILSVHLLEKMPLAQVLSAPDYTLKDADIRNQLSLFDF
ncbi:MAG: IS4 family transposase [Thermoanaerobaculia bacterium]